MIGPEYQVIETKPVNGAINSLERRGRDIVQNEGLSQNVSENKADTKLMGSKIAPRPECL
jgi:hypothetical protein